MQPDLRPMSDVYNCAHESAQSESDGRSLRCPTLRPGQLSASRVCQCNVLSLRMSFAEGRHSARDGSHPIAPISAGAAGE